MPAEPAEPLRLTSPGIRRAGASTTITIDGRVVGARIGETVAAAAAAAGLTVLRHTADGDPRGLFCGMGICFDCAVTIDGRPDQRACLAKVDPGMEVRTREAAGDDVPPAQSWTEHAAEVLVLGAGPAGLAAAIAARKAGAAVTVLDERPDPGGQYHKPLAASHAFADAEAMDRQFADGARLVAQARALGIGIHTDTTVWNAAARPTGGATLHARCGGRIEVWTAARLIVATGAYERALMVSGWTLPGVMTTGAMQTLVRSYRVTPGRRVAIAGNGPLNLQLAVELVRSGGSVAVLAEAAAPPWRGRPADLAALARLAPDLLSEGIAARVILRRHRVPVLHRHVVTRIDRAGAGLAVTLSGIDREGRPMPDRSRRLAVDAVAMGYGFLPSSEITQLLGCRHVIDTRGLGLRGLVAYRETGRRTSLPGVFVAGDAAGAWGARVAAAEGTIAGWAAAAELGHGGTGTAEMAEARAALERAQRFQHALWRLFAAPPLIDQLSAPDALLCRCEAVSWGTVRAVIAGGCDTPSAIKRRTRCGMGRCQGRYCGPVLAALCGGSAHLSHRMPAKPVPAAMLAAGPPAQPAPAIVLPPVAPAAPADAELGQTDIAIIGGGIVGLCAARELALKGAAVTVVERGQPTAEATQGNAGSLHVQLLAYAHPDLDAPGARAALASLRAHAASVKLWQDLAPALDADIELRVGGGLAVADDPADIPRLERKAALERAAGIDVRLVTGTEARALAPALSRRVLAATWCPDEGKLNPLIAGPAIARAALAAGVRMIAATEVVAITEDSQRWVLHTTQGRLRARRILNAAGGWAPGIATMLGAALPVRATPLHMIATAAAPPFLDLLIAHVSDRLTLKQSAAGNLIIGGGWRATSDPASGQPRAGVDACAGNLAVATRVVPSLRRMQVIRTWTAVNSGTAGGPVLCALPNHPRAFVAVTMNGLTLGPAIGRAAADLVLGRRPDPELWPGT